MRSSLSPIGHGTSLSCTIADLFSDTHSISSAVMSETSGKGTELCHIFFKSMWYAAVFVLPGYLFYRNRFISDLSFYGWCSDIFMVSTMGNGAALYHYGLCFCAVYSLVFHSARSSRSSSMSAFIPLLATMSAMSLTMRWLKQSIQGIIRGSYWSRLCRFHRMAFVCTTASLPQ